MSYAAGLVYAVAATRPAWRVLKVAMGAIVAVAVGVVAATRPAWRVLKELPKTLSQVSQPLLQRLDPLGGY